MPAEKLVRHHPRDERTCHGDQRHDIQRPNYRRGFGADVEVKVLGKIKLDEATSNTALSPDQKTLYITNDMYVLRVKMR